MKIEERFEAEAEEIITNALASLQGEPEKAKAKLKELKDQITRTLSDFKSMSNIVNEEVVFARTFELHEKNVRGEISWSLQEDKLFITPRNDNSSSRYDIPVDSKKKTVIRVIITEEKDPAAV